MNRFISGEYVLANLHWLRYKIVQYLYNLVNNIYLDCVSQQMTNLICICEVHP